MPKLRLNPRRVFISTGEVSGDMIGAYLAGELKKLRPELSICGSGGQRMAGAGVEVIFNSNHLGSVAFTEPLQTVPGLIRLFTAIRRHVLREPPGAAVLIGNDLFNALLARWFKSHGIPAIAYFPPQVWVWRAVARPIARSYDLILASFPEEESVYAQAGGCVDFVGHYLVDLIEPATPARRLRARELLGLTGSSTLLALLPGTRRHELEYLTPVLLGAASQLLAWDSGLRFVLPVAESSHRDDLARQIEKFNLKSAVQLTEDSRLTMTACDLLLLASGTATLEAALLGIPMVIVYRVSSWSMVGIRLVIQAGLIQSETVGLPNLVLQQDVVPELRQARATAQNLALQAKALLNNRTAQGTMTDRLSLVASTLGGKGGLNRAARRICAVLEREEALLPGSACGCGAAHVAPQDSGCHSIAQGRGISKGGQ
jgi:lipid-A-disaccharide synthase